ncbi:MAG: hypothetical protein FWC79_04635 [Oscillospiraceae bacterium]|nr:hypothetical protein [Oscillospiraceae bacterium]
MLSVAMQVIRNFTKEFDDVKHMSRLLLSALEEVKEEEIQEKIGIFARHEFEWDYFIDLKKPFLSLVRQVCTGEIPVSSAIDAIKSFLDGLESEPQNWPD